MINIGVRLKEDKSLSQTDRLAIALNNLFNDSGEINRTYHGVFSEPYNRYTGKAEEHKDSNVEAMCDVMIDGEPHSFGWRWWGKRAEVLIEEMKKTALELKDI